MTDSLLAIALAQAEFEWWNYPGFELWKFVNLTIFIIAAYAIHKFLGKPIANGLQSRREAIGRALAQARKERDEALKKLADVEARLALLDSEIASIRDRSVSEAEAETRRIQTSTETELIKLRESAKREVDAAAKAASSDLRRFASEESIRLAQEFVEGQITPQDDAKITKDRAQRLGGSAH